MNEMNRLNAENQYTLFPSASVYLAESLTANPRVQAAQYMDFGRATGSLFSRIAEFLTYGFRRANLRHELNAMDDRMLADIGIARGDIEEVIAGTYGVQPVAPVQPKPAAEVRPIPVKSESPKVEAIMRRAA